MHNDVTGFELIDQFGLGVCDWLVCEETWTADIGTGPFSSGK